MTSGAPSAVPDADPVDLKNNRSRGANFHAAVLKPSMAMGQPPRSWTA